MKSQSLRSDIREILDYLLDAEKDLKFCFLATKEFITFMPSEKFMNNVDEKLLYNVQKLLDSLFPIIEQFWTYKLAVVYIELKNCMVSVWPIYPTVALVGILDKLANVGLLEIEFVNAIEKIRKIF